MGAFSVDLGNFRLRARKKARVDQDLNTGLFDAKSIEGKRNFDSLTKRRKTTKICMFIGLHCSDPRNGGKLVDGGPEKRMSSTMRKT